MGARAGSKAYVGFEGGQMPLQRRVPKRGFHNKWRVEYRVVNIGSLAKLEGVEKITPALLREHGLVKGRGPVKVLGVGELDRPLTICAQAFSKSAIGKIEGAGGVVEVLQ
jgi:large subunit ribosomal protein L15